MMISLNHGECPHKSKNFFDGVNLHQLGVACLDITGDIWKLLGISLMLK
jgi:hypothetical protein